MVNAMLYHDNALVVMMMFNVGRLTVDSTTVSDGLLEIVSERTTCLKKKKRKKRKLQKL